MNNILATLNRVIRERPNTPLSPSTPPMLKKKKTSVDERLHRPKEVLNKFSFKNPYNYDDLQKIIDTDSNNCPMLIQVIPKPYCKPTTELLGYLKGPINDSMDTIINLHKVFISATDATQNHDKLKSASKKKDEIKANL